MRAADIAGFAEAQRVARAAILEVAETVRVGETERTVAARVEARLAGAKVRRWLHTPYAWWGERSRFGGFGRWEPSALPTERRLAEGEAWILDVAPLVNGYPADFAISGIAGASGSQAALHGQLLSELAEIKRDLVGWARAAAEGREISARVDDAVRTRGREAIHPLYPAATLGHAFTPFPSMFGRLPRMGSGFQWPLLGTTAWGLAAHQLLGAPYPFLSSKARGSPRGLFAVEPHIAQGALGAKFESVLLIDGDETRWLDPDLFGEVRG